MERFFSVIHIVCPAPSRLAFDIWPIAQLFTLIHSLACSAFGSLSYLYITHQTCAMTFMRSPVLQSQSSNDPQYHVGEDICAKRSWLMYVVLWASDPHFDISYSCSRFLSMMRQSWPSWPATTLHQIGGGEQNRKLNDLHDTLKFNQVEAFIYTPTVAQCVSRLSSLWNWLPMPLNWTSF